MEKYKVTKDHPLLKTGALLVGDESASSKNYKVFMINGELLGMDLEDLNKYTEQGWLVKVGELLYSEKDMIDFARFRFRHRGDIVETEDLFKDWKK